MRTKLFSKLILRVILSALVLACITVFPITVRGGPGQTLNEKFGEDAVKKISRLETTVYSEIAEENQNAGIRRYTGEPVIIPSGAGKSENGAIISGEEGGRENVLVWDAAASSYTWEIEAPEDALYCLNILYFALDGNGDNAQRRLYIDGKVPFDEAYTLSFDRYWTEDGKPSVNSLGDEVRPGQKEIREWRSFSLTDSRGLYSAPFEFYLTKGIHSIKLEWVAEPLAIGEIALTAPVVLPDYAEYIKAAKDGGYNNANDSVYFEAEENVSEKNSQVVRREYNGDPKTTPAAGTSKKLNVLGASRWSDGGQSVTWEFNVTEPGLYRLDMRLGQWFTDGLPVYRAIYIDDKIPFSELAEHGFEFQPDWRLETLQNGTGEPYLFALSAGRHTLTMKAVLGPVTEIVQQLDRDALLLSEYYRKIITLTGVDPDPNFEYDLDKSIKGLIKAFTQISDDMDFLVNRLTELSVKRPSAANNFLTIREKFQKMIKRPDSISRSFTDLQNAMSGLGDYIVSLQDTALVIDSFSVSAPEREYANVKSGFFRKLWASVQNIFLSFFKDYDNVAGLYNADENNSTLKIWVGRGTEWAEIIKQMSDTDFTPAENVNVSVNILPAGQLSSGSVNAILLAVAAGTGPDLALGVAANSPVEFAIRGAVADMTRFEGFSRVKERFYPSIFTPFTYKDGVYALPEQMDFSVLFYRSDILEEMNLRVPQTWTEVYEKTLPALTQNGMEFAPAPFSTFLFQLGGRYYTEDGLKSALDSPQAYQAFEEWTGQYISYGMPIEYNFFNRFRTGEMPIGFGGYSAYVQIATAAPELYGRWEIAPVPGHLRQDGTIDRSIGEIAGLCAVILSESKLQKEGFRFLDWWTSDDVQVSFGRELEALLGTSARWNPANVNAFARLPWDTVHRDVIINQLEWGRETPVVLGSYFTSRHLSNAWSRVVMSGMYTGDGKGKRGRVSPRDSLDSAIRDINKEMKAKQTEYNTTNKRK